MPGILHANCEKEKKNHSHKCEFDKQTSQENNFDHNNQIIPWLNTTLSWINKYDQSKKETDNPLHIFHARTLT